MDVEGCKSVDSDKIIILEPLKLMNNSDVKQITSQNVNLDVSCLLCEKIFKFDSEKDEYIYHLYCSHRLVIGEINNISLLPEYLTFWKREFNGQPLTEYCTTVFLDQLPSGTFSLNERYYLLSDDLPKDFEIRKKLQTKRLEQILSQHQFERTDQTFQRNCLFCRDIIEPNRVQFVDHLFRKHFFQLGRAEKLVFIDELLDLIEQTFSNLICIYCDKTFKDRSTLKEHMRKKRHKQINPLKKEYDRFYLINYYDPTICHYEPKNTTVVHQSRPLQKNRNTTDQIRTYCNEFVMRDFSESRNRRRRHHQQPQQQQQQRVQNQSINDDKESVSNVFQTDDSDSDWSEWQGDCQDIICLYCPFKQSNIKILKNHMIIYHKFDFDEVVSEMNFYQKIKLVNFIRRQIHVLRCPKCDVKFDSKALLNKHFEDEQHFGVGLDKTLWDQQQYYFPTYEDDSFLCYLEDPYADYEKDDSIVIYSENLETNINLTAEELSKETLLELYNT